MDEEMDKESITTIMEAFEAEAEAENIKRQMHSTMKGNGQTESSTDNDRSSNGSAGSYKGNNSKGYKQTTCSSMCGEPDHNAFKCKVKHIIL